MRHLWALLLLAALAFSPTAWARPVQVHIVQSGQRLGSIAKRFGVSIEALCNANGLKRNAVIKPGLRLAIPPKDDTDGTETRKLVKAGAISRVSLADEEQDKPSKDEAAPERRTTGGHSGRGSSAEGKSKGDWPKTHVVQSGQRLGTIAKRYRVSVDAICIANGLTPTSRIKPGLALTIPDPATPLERIQPPNDDRDVAALPRPRKGNTNWKSYAHKPWRNGYVTIIGHHGTWKGYALGRRGELLSTAQRGISRILAWPHRDLQIDKRLITLLVKTSNTFGGRPLRVVSGYRTTSWFRDSKHKAGKACDFRVVGVPNEALRDYLRTLDKVGVGYYPNSTFVHLDARDVRTYWIDYAGPGEAPRSRRTRPAHPRGAVPPEVGQVPDDTAGSVNEEAEDDAANNGGGDAAHEDAPSQAPAHDGATKPHTSAN